MSLLCEDSGLDVAGQNASLSPGFLQAPKDAGRLSEKCLKVVKDTLSSSNHPKLSFSLCPLNVLALHHRQGAARHDKNGINTSITRGQSR